VPEWPADLSQPTQLKHVNQSILKMNSIQTTLPDIRSTWVERIAFKKN
jgi:hypothetical protein